MVASDSGLGGFARKKYKRFGIICLYLKAYNKITSIINKTSMQGWINFWSAQIQKSE